MSWEQPIYRYEQHLIPHFLNPDSCSTHQPEKGRTHTNSSPHASFSERGEEPPTPTRTPTSATFLQTSFETPKQESSFYDSQANWNTADPCATSPDFLKTPKFQTFSTSKGSPSLTGLSRKRRLSGAEFDEDSTSQAQNPSPTSNISLPPSELSRQRSKSPGPSTSSYGVKGSRRRTPKFAATPLKLGSEEEIDPSLRSAGSMQTPPPTTSSASRRKMQQTQSAKLAKQSDVSAARRLSTPSVHKPRGAEAAGSQVGDTHLQLGDFQFSPHAFDFPPSGAASSPGFPQHKLFWNPDQSKEAMNLDFPIDDPFAIDNSPKGLDPFAVGCQGSQFPASASFNDFSTKSGQTTDISMLLDLDLGNDADFLPPPGILSDGKSFTKVLGKGVNPSLLFSSPGRLPSPSLSAGLCRSDALQPYAQQVREAQLENQLNRERRAKKRRKPEVDSPAVKVALQALRDEQEQEQDMSLDVNETATDRAIELLRRPQSQRSRISFQSSKASAHVRYSDPHRLETSKIPRSRKKRPVVTLTIDAEGRAKTETKVVCDDDDIDESSPHSKMDMGSDSEDSETTSSSGSTIMLLSRPQSFSFTNQSNRKPELPRISTEAKRHSQMSSYSPNLTKNSKIMEDTKLPRGFPGVDVHGRSYAINELRRASSPATISEDRGHRKRIAASGESDPETILSSDDDKGDAQYELKKIRQERARDRAVMRSGLKNGHTRDDHACVSHGDLMQQRYSGSSNRRRASDAFENISPTTVTDPDSATPSTGTEGYETTRCVCQHSEIEGELMILW